MSDVRVMAQEASAAMPTSKLKKKIKEAGGDVTKYTYSFTWIVLWKRTAKRHPDRHTTKQIQHAVEIIEQTYSQVSSAARTTQGLSSQHAAKQTKLTSLVP